MINPQTCRLTNTKNEELTTYLRICFSLCNGIDKINKLSLLYVCREKDCSSNQTVFIFLRKTDDLNQGCEAVVL